MAGVALPARRPPARPFAAAPRPLPAARPEGLFLWIAASLLFVTATLNFYIFQVSVVATSAYEIQHLERERDAWRARNDQLALEVAKARSLRWIEHQAVQRLGMVKAEDPIFIPVEGWDRGEAEGAPGVNAPAEVGR